MRKITMKSTKSTSENGGSVRDKSEDRATNFSDQDNDTKQDATGKDANKSFDTDKSFADSENGKQSDHLDDDDLDNNSDDEAPVGKAKSKKTPKSPKKKAGNAAVNGKAGSKKKPKKKKGAAERKSGAAAEEDTEEEYEVEKIVDRKKIGSKTYFLIRWKGYSAKDDTWEAENTLNCEELIKDYVDKVKKEPAKSRKRSPEPARRSKRVDYTEDEEDDYETFLSTPRKRKSANVSSSSRGKRARQDDSEDDDDDETPEEYEVDKILKVQNMKRGGREFLVRWKGYPESQATWEPEKNLNCRDLLDRFLEKQKENHSPKNNKVSPPKKKKGVNSGRRSGRKGR